MAKAYPSEAIELCRRLYCKYGGKNHDAIQQEMRKAGWAGWNKLNLHNRGKEGTRSERMGWIDRYGFENSLRLHLEKLTEKVNNDEQDLYLGIRTIRKQLQNEAVGNRAGKDVRREYREYAKLEIEARRNLDLTRDNFETFVSGLEKLVIWLGDKDPDAARGLVRNSDWLTEMAQAHYGKAEADAGASDREDEGGDRPFSLLA